MNSSTITKKGQITIPKKLRDEFGIEPHDKVVFVRRGDVLVLKPVKDIYSIRGAVRVNKIQDFNKIRNKIRKSNAERIADE